jgi:hypothetical protein
MSPTLRHCGAGGTEVVVPEMTGETLRLIISHSRRGTEAIVAPPPPMMRTLPSS